MGKKKEEIKLEEKKTKKGNNFYRFTFIILILNIIIFNILNIFLRKYIILGSILFIFLIYLFHKIIKKINNKFLKKVANLMYIILIIILLIFNFTAFKAKNIITEATPSTAISKPVNIKNQSFNVLLTGVDTRADGENVGLKNSDAIMVASINPKTQEILLTSLPRDAYVTLACTDNFDKLTHASTFEQGEQCLVQTVENILDIDINYFVSANFDAVIKSIDAIGGINIDINQEFCGQDEKDKKEAFCFKKGLNHLTGEEALSYARERKSFATGDYARIEHQQAVVEAFIKEVKKHPFKINKLFEIGAKNLITNLSMNEINSLIELFLFNDFNIENNKVVGEGMIVDIEYEGLYGVSVQLLDQSSLTTSKFKISEVLGE